MSQSGSGGCRACWLFGYEYGLYRQARTMFEQILIPARPKSWRDVAILRCFSRICRRLAAKSSCRRRAAGRVKIADHHDDLWDGTLDAAQNIQEDGNSVVSDVVFTGSDCDGNFNTASPMSSNVGTDRRCNSSNTLPPIPRPGPRARTRSPVHSRVTSKRPTVFQPDCESRPESAAKRRYFLANQSAFCPPRFSAAVDLAAGTLGTPPSCMGRSLCLPGSGRNVGHDAGRHLAARASAARTQGPSSGGKIARTRFTGCRKICRAHHGI